MNMIAQKIQHWFLPSQSMLSNAPNITALVLDQSTSMGDSDWKPSRMAGVKEAANQFLYVKRQCDPQHVVAVISFDCGAYLQAEPVPVFQGFQSLQKSIKKLKPSGGTNIDAALRACIPVLFPEQGQSTNFNGIPHYSKRSILLVTDGEGGDPREIAKWLKRNDVRLECIGVGGSPKNINEKLLKEIASVENWRVLYRFIGDKQVLVQHFGELARSL